MLVFHVKGAEAPRRVYTANPALLEYRSGGGLGNVLFGLPFLGAGGFLLWAALFRGVPKFFQAPPGGPASPLESLGLAGALLLGGGCGVTFAGVGVWCLFGREGVAFDRQAGAVTLWRGLPFWKWSRSFGLVGYTAVGVKRTGGSFRTGPMYSVLLSGAGVPDLAVADVRVSHERAEQLADEVTAFLGLHRPHPPSQAGP